MIFVYAKTLDRLQINDVAKVLVPLCFHAPNCRIKEVNMIMMSADRLA